MTCQLVYLSNFMSILNSILDSIPDFIPWIPVPVASLLAITTNSVTMGIEQGSHDAPDGYVVVEATGYNITCLSWSILRSVTGWGSVVNVTVDKLLPGEEYTCYIIAISKVGPSNSTLINVNTTPSG